MRVCFFGTYQRDHSANRLLREALVRGGADVEELHEPLWEETRDKDAAYFAPTSLAVLAARWSRRIRRLARRWSERTGPPPIVLVGFGGQLDVLVASWICRPRVGLVFAPLVSLSETLVEDRRLFAPSGLRGRLVATLDRRTLATADLVLADTAAHAEYLVELGAPADRVAVWYLGVESEFVTPRGPERAAARAYAAARRISIAWRDPVPLGSLPDEIAAADVVLGVFGSSRKAAMVVPNKVWQAAAMGAPVVTRDGPAIREVLRPGHDCVVCPPADPGALAQAVRRVLARPDEAARLGRAARAHVLEHYGPGQQAHRLVELLSERFAPRPSEGAAHG
jgi:glycosyltransferase involved in cell wall biosynthesis